MLTAAEVRASRTRRAAAEAQRRGHLPAPMPRYAPIGHLEDAYAARVRIIVGAAARAAFGPLIARLPGMLAAELAARGDARLDASESASASIHEARRQMSGELELGSRSAAKSASADVDSHNRIQLGRQVRAIAGIGLAPSAQVEPIIGQFIRDNVALIGGLSARLAADVEKMVAEALTAGRLHESFGADLRDRLRITESRAQLIAVDQLGKLHGQINAQRQQDLGVAEFVWRTSEDERVRGNPSGKYPRANPSHHARHGHTFSYADPPKGRDGEKELPGTPIRCRCIAEPVLTKLVDQQGPDGAAPEDLAPPLDPEMEADARAQLAALEAAGPVAPFDADAVRRAIEAARVVSASGSPPPRPADDSALAALAARLQPVSLAPAPLPPPPPPPSRPAAPPPPSSGSSSPSLTPGAAQAGLDNLVRLIGTAAPPPPPPPPDVTVRAPATPAEVPIGAAAAETHDRDPVVRHIADGAAENPRALGGGMNVTFRVTVRAVDGTTVDAAWKPLADTKPRNWPCPKLDWKKTPEREHAASIVAEQLGVRDLMPVATVRDVAGKRGSVQVFAEGVTEYPTGPVNAEAMQRMRVFDFITGNRDRHQSNALWQGGTPVLIDHGLSFPSGPPDRFVQPASHVLRDLPAGPISQELVEFVHRIDERGLAASLHAAGIDAKAITHTLYRLRALKANPQGLASTGRYLDDRLTWGRMVKGAETAITEDDRNEIDTVVRSARKKRR